MLTSKNQNAINQLKPFSQTLITKVPTRIDKNSVAEVSAELSGNYDGLNHKPSVSEKISADKTSKVTSRNLITNQKKEQENG